ncbi:MAG: FHA domain-containing protein [Nitrospirae bacterium YQR-1]
MRIHLLKKAGVSEDRESIIHKGKKLFDEGKYREAKEQFKAILVGDANNEEVKKYIDRIDAYEPLDDADKLLKDKKYIEARALYQKVFDSDPNQIKAKKGVKQCKDALNKLSDDFLKKAEDELKLENFDSALKNVMESLKNNPENVQAKSLLERINKRSFRKRILMASVISLSAVFFILILATYVSARRRKSKRCNLCGSIIAAGKQTCGCQNPNVFDNKTVALKNRQLSCTLIIENGPYKGQRYEITELETFIGSDDTNEISFPEDAAISRRHAKIRSVGGGYVLTDLKTTNGTLVNGTPITTQCSIVSGDVITIGETEIKVHVG